MLTSIILLAFTFSSSVVKAEPFYEPQNIWSAYLKLSPKGNIVTVKGHIYVPNSGYNATIVKVKPQGFNSRVLFLEVTLIKPTPGRIYPQVSSRIDFVEVYYGNYEKVQVRVKNKVIRMKVINKIPLRPKK